MASGDRFYQIELRHREAVWGDIGNILKVEGLIVGGEFAQAILMLPGTTLQEKPQIEYPDAEEWTAWLQHSDNPEVLVMPAKAFHRKLRYEISGAVQQKVWYADGMGCMYCGKGMGAVQLTIDHFTPLEMGGVNDTTNYLSACRRCNKDKGAMAPQDWCSLKKLDYEALVEYLKHRRLP